ncbi:MAG: hypothetical protein AAF597_04510 [Bacteroidota bacterium]
MIRYFLLFLPLLLHSCAKPGPGLPPPEAELLAPVVADLQLAEALSSEVPVLVRDSMRNVIYDLTLADHDLDRATFDSLLWIVRAEPEWVDSLYSRVGVILAAREAEDE